MGQLSHALLTLMAALASGLNVGLMALTRRTPSGGDRHPARTGAAVRAVAAPPVLQVVQRVVGRHLLEAAGIKADEGHSGAVALIQRFGSAANLNVHLHCLVLDGVYRCDAGGLPSFI